MSQIDRYVLVDRNNHEGDHEYETMDAAIADASSDHAVVERQYTFSDSELVWTPDGGNTWPPSKAKRANG
jgi:hypothetical protein